MSLQQLLRRQLTSRLASASSQAPLLSASAMTPAIPTLNQFQNATRDGIRIFSLGSSFRFEETVLETRSQLQTHIRKQLLSNAQGNRIPQYTAPHSGHCRVIRNWNVDQRMGNLTSKTFQNTLQHGMTGEYGSRRKLTDRRSQKKFPRHPCDQRESEETKVEELADDRKGRIHEAITECLNSSRSAGFSNEDSPHDNKG